jgi:hypothetical protein
MTIHVPRRTQGQIIEVGYGWHVGEDSADLYCREIDQSYGLDQPDRRITWWRASDEQEVAEYAGASSELWEEAPLITAWEPCADPTEDDGHDEAGR